MNKHYFLVADFNDKDKFEKIVFASWEEVSKQSITSRSAAYDTEEELRIDCEVLKKPCSVCGGLISTTYIDKVAQQLIKHRMCFMCNCMREIAELAATDKSRMIVKGKSYHVLPDNPGAYFKGFGGRTFKFRRFDSPDKIIVSKNTWSQGDIPEIWRDKIKDNAEIIS